MVDQWFLVAPPPCCIAHHCTLRSGGRSLQSRAADASCPKSTRSWRPLPQNFPLLLPVLPAYERNPDCRFLHPYISHPLFSDMSRASLCNSMSVWESELLIFFKHQRHSFYYIDLSIPHFAQTINSCRFLAFSAQHLLVQPLQRPKQSLRCQWSVQNCLGRMAQLSLRPRPACWIDHELQWWNCRWKGCTSKHIIRIQNAGPCTLDK